MALVYFKIGTGPEQLYFCNEQRSLIIDKVKFKYLSAPVKSAFLEMSYEVGSALVGKVDR